jgi:hypothetical protein
MTIYWKNLVFRLLVWLALELLLGFLDLDELADYSEFLGERTLVIYLT